MYKKNYKLVLSLIMVLLVGLVLAGCLFPRKGVNFEGVVLDADDAPLAGIKVVLRESQTSYITGADGRFVFQNVDAGPNLVLLDGDQGIGQIAVDIMRDMDPVVYRYPVITEVAFLHVNDVHAEIENFAKLAYQADLAREQYNDVFVLCGGDIFSGNPLVDLYDPKGQPMIELMNKVGFDAMVLGNHDFDYGQSILNDRMSEADFPMLSANTYVVTGELNQPNPFTYLETSNQLIISVLGLTNRSSTTGIPATHPDNVIGLEFFDPIEFAKGFGYLRDADLFMALTHIGDYNDDELANQMGELDLIIGGHSHTLMNNATWINNVPIVQAGSDLKYLGKVIVTLANGVVESVNSEMIDLNAQTEEDTEVRQMIDIIKAGSTLDEVIATVDSAIDGKDELGSLITDSMAAQHGLDIAFTNNGGIRISSLEGDITLNDIYELLPFGNDIVKYEMTTDEVRSLIAYTYNRWENLDLQVSGIQYVINVVDGILDSIDLLDYTGTPIDEAATYLVGLNSYIASSYEFDHTDPGTSLYTTCADTLIAYIRDGHDLNYDGVSRIKIEKTFNAQVIATTEVEITAGDKYSGSFTAGNLIADAMRANASADIAIFPSSSLNNATSPIQPGDVTDLALLDLYKYRTNTVTITDVTGADLKALILARSERYDNADVQVSGMTYTITDLGDSVTVECYEADFVTPIEDTTVYTVAFDTYNYQYYGLTSPTTVTNETQEDILLEYVTNLPGPIPASLAETRIIVQ